MQTMARHRHLRSWKGPIHPFRSIEPIERREISSFQPLSIDLQRRNGIMILISFASNSSHAFIPSSEFQMLRRKEGSTLVSRVVESCYRANGPLALITISQPLPFLRPVASASPVSRDALNAPETDNACADQRLPGCSITCFLRRSVPSDGNGSCHARDDTDRSIDKSVFI